jgi:hypothetical protein
LVVATKGVSQTYEAAETFMAQGKSALAGVSGDRLRTGFSSLIEGLMEGLPEA